MNTQSEDAKKYPNADRPAFPTNARMFDAAQGLTKREYFAARALHGLLSDPKRDRGIEFNCGVAIQYADALIEALNK